MQAEMESLCRTQPHPHRPDLFTPMPTEGAPVDPANPHAVWRIMDLPVLGDTWFELVVHEPIVAIMCDLLGPNVNFHNGKAIIKPPRYDMEAHGWHQDFPYERHSQPELAAVIVYLDEVDADEGATWIVPGSHKLGEIPHGQSFVGHALRTDDWAKRGVPVKASPGDALFFSVLLVHAAGANRTDVSRRGIINEYKSLEAKDEWGNRLAFAEMPLTRGGEILMKYRGRL